MPQFYANENGHSLLSNPLHPHVWKDIRNEAIMLMLEPGNLHVHVFSRKSDCLGCAVLLCLVCLFDLACFFLSSFSSLIQKHVYRCTYNYMKIIQAIKLLVIGCTVNEV